MSQLQVETEEEMSTTGDRITIRNGRFQELGRVASILVAGFYGKTVWCVFGGSCWCPDSLPLALTLRHLPLCPTRFAPLCLRELNRLQGNFPYDLTTHRMFLAVAEAEEGGSADRQEDDRIVGFVDIDQRIPTKPQPDDAPRPYLSDLAVCSNWRRQGIARALIMQCENLCREEWGHRAIYLKVDRTNGAAVKLYASLGYTTVKEFQDSSKVNERPAKHAPRATLSALPLVLSSWQVLMEKILVKDSEAGGAPPR